MVEQAVCRALAAADRCDWSKRLYLLRDVVRHHTVAHPKTRKYIYRLMCMCRQKHSKVLNRKKGMNEPRAVGIGAERAVKLHGLCWKRSLYMCSRQSKCPIRHSGMPCLAIFRLYYTSPLATFSFGPNFDSQLYWSSLVRLHSQALTKM